MAPLVGALFFLVPMLLRGNAYLNRHYPPKKSGAVLGKLLKAEAFSQSQVQPAFYQHALPDTCDSFATPGLPKHRFRAYKDRINFLILEPLTGFNHGGPIH